MLADQQDKNVMEEKKSLFITLCTFLDQSELLWLFRHNYGTALLTRSSDCFAG